MKEETEAASLGELFQNWLWTSEIGDTLVYFQGNLATDRQRYPQIAEGANAVWRAYLDGLVCFTQRLRDDGVYEYNATRCSRPPIKEKPQLSASSLE